MQPQPLPSPNRLAGDIRTVMTVGIGRPYRGTATTPDLERIAKEIVPDPSLLSFGLCGAAIEQIAFGLGESDYDEAVRIMFRIGAEAEPLIQLKDRAQRAARKLGRRSAELEETDLERMCRTLADAMLKVVAERRTPVATVSVAEGVPDTASDSSGNEPPAQVDSAGDLHTDGAQPHQGRGRLGRALGIGAALALLIGFVLVLADRPSSHLTTTSLSRLSKEAERNLTGREAPQPSKQMTAVLGYGDPIPGGRPTYREHKGQITPPTTPTFDSILNAQNGVGDERRFLHVESSLATDSEQLWQIPEAHTLVANPHEIVWAIVDIDNNAQATADCDLSSRYVAIESRLRVAIWNSADDHLHVIRAWLSAKNATPPWITDAVAVLTRNVTTLEPDSALSREYSTLSPRFRANPSINVESLLLYPGLLIGGDGLVGSCWDNRYYFALGFRQT